MGPIDQVRPSFPEQNNRTDTLGDVLSQPAMRQVYGAVQKSLKDSGIVQLPEADQFCELLKKAQEEINQRDGQQGKKPQPDTQMQDLVRRLGDVNPDSGRQHPQPVKDCTGRIWAHTDNGWECRINGESVTPFKDYVKDVAQTADGGTKIALLKGDTVTYKPNGDLEIKYASGLERSVKFDNQGSPLEITEKTQGGRTEKFTRQGDDWYDASGKKLNGHIDVDRDTGSYTRAEGLKRVTTHLGGLQEQFIRNEKSAEVQFGADGKTPEWKKTYYSRLGNGGLASEEEFKDGKQIRKTEYEPPIALETRGRIKSDIKTNSDGTEERSKFDVLGRLKTTEHLKDGKLVSVDDYVGGKLNRTSEYDGEGKLKSKTEFDSLRNPLRTVKYENGEETALTTYTYKDGKLSRKEETDLTGPTLRMISDIRYDSQGRMVEQTTPHELGWQHVTADGTLITDNAGRLRRFTNAATHETIELGYDTKGRVNQFSDSRGQYVSTDGKNWYQAGNQPPAEPDWKGTITVDEKNTVTERSIAGSTHRWRTDGTHSFKNANGAEIDYDAKGRVTRALDQQGNQTTLGYRGDERDACECIDSRGRYVREKDTCNWYKDDNKEKRQPDWVGTVRSTAEGTIKETDGRGKITSWLLDGSMRVAEPVLPLREFKDAALTLFDKLDTNGNGYLSAKELARAVQDPNLTGREAQIAAALYKNLDQIKKLSKDEWGWESEISKADIKKLGELIERRGQEKLPEDEEKLVRSVGWRLGETAAAQRRNANSDYKLWGATDRPLTPNMITQGAIGNCYFCATVAGLLKNNPQAIKDMIQDNNNGTYTVTFPGDKDHPITVGVPADGEMGIYGSQYNGHWFSVLEKAFGQYKNDQRWVNKGYTSTDGSDGGGWTRDVIKLFTGNDSTVYDVSNAANLKEELTQALAEGRIITTYTPSHKDGDEGKTVDGYAANHAYTILGYDPVHGKLTVRNPWNDSGKKGTFEISWDEYQRNFEKVTIQKSV